MLWAYISVRWLAGIDRTSTERGDNCCH